MHRFGLRATVMRSSNFWTVFVSSGASNEWSRTRQNSLMETYPFLLLQEPWRCLALASTLLDHNSLQCNHKCRSEVYSMLKSTLRDNYWFFPSITSHTTIAVWLQYLIYCQKKKKPAHNPGMRNLQGDPGKCLWEVVRALHVPQLP